VLDGIGGLLAVQEFAAAAGYARLLGWLQGFGTVGLVDTEGSGSYGTGLARHIAAAGIRVVEVDRSDRQERRRRGKSDPLDAVNAARAASRAAHPGRRAASRPHLVSKAGVAVGAAAGMGARMGARFCSEVLGPASSRSPIAPFDLRRQTLMEAAAL